MNKRKEQIENLIDKLGLWNAKEALGISLAKLVKLVGLKIHPNLAGEIIVDGINNKTLPKEIDCMYLGTKSYLSDIAGIINKLDDYKVPILTGRMTSSYVGHYHPLNLKLIGLEQGIKETYNKLKNEL
jgi:hypothetical protein